MAEKPADDKSKKGGGGVVKIAIFAVGGLLLVGIGLGAGYFIFSGSEPPPAEQLLGPDGLPVPAATASVEPEIDPNVELDANGNPIPKKMVKETPVQETYVTTYYEFAGLKLKTFDTQQPLLLTNSFGRQAPLTENTSSPKSFAGSNVHQPNWPHWPA